MIDPLISLRVMLVISTDQLGGGWRVVELLARHLDRRRFNVSLVCPRSSLTDRLGRAGDVHVYPFSFPVYPNVRTLRHLASLIRTERVDILHTHLFHGDLYGLLASRLVSVPVLAATLHNVNFFWETEPFPRRVRWRISSQVYRGMYRFFNGMAACSEAVRQAVCSRPGIKLRPERVRVIHNGIEISQIRTAGEQTAERNAAPYAFSGRARSFRIVTVAAFAPVKGHRVLLEALRRLVPEFALECLLIGDGPERPAIQARARALGLDDTVRFLGRREDVPALLRGSDLFVLPSIWDGFGIAMLEAMALEVPVVACESGGVPEIITNGQTGLLVSPEDPVGLAEAMKRLLQDRVLARDLAARARERVERHFDALGMVRSYEQWYEDLMRSKRGVGHVA
ncbi:MAG: glycosyltransferase [Candidatus Omnitrophota bacterium]|nr:glycosyltransferase [Candidatus Omnitrophota bacterium]